MFATKIGVGVHMSSAHVSASNDQIDVARVKSRWPPEAELVFEGIPSGQINGILYEKHRGRTHEAIKGRRKTQKRRELVAVHLEGLRENPLGRR